MEKHVYFFIGVFVTPIISIPILLGVIGAADSTIRDIGVFAFGIMTSLIVALIVMLLFRKFIFERMKLSASHKTEDITKSITQTISNITKGDMEGAVASTERLLNIGASWYSWSNFYRWVFRTSISLIVVFVGSVGTLLLFEQNKKLENQTVQLKSQNENIKKQTEQLKNQNSQFSQQNELLSLSLVADLRNRLKSKVEFVSNPLFLEAGTVRGSTCKWEMLSIKNLRDEGYHTLPNPSTISAIVGLASSEITGNQIKEAVTHLLTDSDNTVSVGAFQILDRINLVPKEITLKISRMQISDLKILNSKPNITIINSYIENLRCEGCNIDLNGSLIAISTSSKINLNNSIVKKGWNAESPELEVKSVRSSIVELEDNDPRPWGYKYENSLIMGKYSQEEFEEGGNDARLDLWGLGEQITSVQACERLHAICAKNNFLACSTK